MCVLANHYYAPSILQGYTILYLQVKIVQVQTRAGKLDQKCLSSIHLVFFFVWQKRENNFRDFVQCVTEIIIYLL